LRNETTELEQDWDALVAHTKTERSDLVLLPEMTFHPWLAATDRVDRKAWLEAVRTHDRWLERLPELATAVVIGTRPIIQEGTPFNQGYVWTHEIGCRPVHTKYYLPNEAGFWEAKWYRRGQRSFESIEVQGVKLGFLICTEVWFTAHAREYAKQGVHLVVCPRATEAFSTDKWVAGGRAAAVVSGAYCLSSNFSGRGSGVDWGGTAWVIEPEEGTVLGLSSKKQPFLTFEIDLQVAEKAKHTYPRYVTD